MNILLLESSYSTYHQSIIKEFSGNHYCFLFDIGYSLFNYQLSLVNVQNALKSIEVSDADVEFVRDIVNLQTIYYEKVIASPIDSNYLLTAAKYAIYLRRFLSEKSIGLVLMHNDLRWQHAIAIKVLRKEGVPYFVTERGMLRPYTTTLDPTGVNANSDAVRCPDKYLNYPVIEPNEFSRVPKFDKGKTYFGFLSFLMLSQIGDILGLNVKFRHKKYSLGSYFRIYLSEKARAGSTDISDAYCLPENFVYFPLQVRGDSQVLIHSDFSSMQEAISVVEKQFYAANLTSHRLVVNLHPMEPASDYDFDARTIISRAPTDLLIDRSDAVVSINSTVGVEAMRKCKPLHLMGRAYFSDSNYMYIAPKGECLRDSLRKQLVSNELPPKIQDSAEFIDDVSMRNQILGDVYRYDNRLASNTAAIINATLLSGTKSS